MKKHQQMFFAYLILSVVSIMLSIYIQQEQMQALLDNDLARESNFSTLLTFSMILNISSVVGMLYYAIKNELSL